MTDNVHRQAGPQDSETDEFQLEVNVKIDKKIFLRSFRWALLLMLLAGAVGPQAVGQTSGNVPVPEYYGTYAVADGKLIDLISSLPTEVRARIGKLPGEDVGLGGFGGVGGGRCDASAVAKVFTDSLLESPSDVQFLRYAEAWETMDPDARLKLTALIYVRNVQVSGCSPPKTGVEEAWDSGLGDSVELRLKPVPGHQDMVLAVPSSPLNPGVYLLQGVIREGRIYSVAFAVSPLADAEATKCRDLTVFPLSLAGALQKPQLRACGNSRAASSSTSAIGAGTTSTPGTAQPPASVTCADYMACITSGSAALGSSQWIDAMAFFQGASTLEPSKTGGWNGIASVYLATGRQQEAPAMWDKALSLGGPVGFTVCHQRGLSSCEQGTLLLGPKEVSFTTTAGQKLFAVSPSEVSSVQAHKVFTSTYIRFSIKGKNYNFDFFPIGVDCGVRNLVTCPSAGRAQQAAVDDYVSAAVPKLASEALGPQPTAMPGASASNAPSNSTSANLQLAEQARKVIANYETPSFHSPLDDEQLLQSIISESQASGVPPWLLFGQAKFETTFGDPINATVRDGMTFTDGSTGNAHNLFNIRPGTSWAGKVIDTGRGGKFRVYASYEDSVRDYLSLMSSDLYKGKNLDSLINTYFPPGENGPARVEEYITSVIEIANKLGFTVDKNTIPVH